MFKRGVFKLAGPICLCDTMSLGWRITTDSDERHGLQIECKSCKVRLMIPWEQFKCGFELDVPYPKGREPAPVEDDRPKLEVINGGAVGE